jgi:hypothetical protein
MRRPAERDAAVSAEGGMRAKFVTAGVIAVTIMG